MADKYNFHNLRTKLLSFNYCSLDQLQRLEGFDELPKDDQVKLAMKRIKYAVDEDSVNSTYKMFHMMYEKTEEALKHKKVCSTIYVSQKFMAH